MKTMNFWQLPIGDFFVCNGNICQKMTRRTAKLLDYGKTFYFGRFELCKID